HGVLRTKRSAAVLTTEDNLPPNGDNTRPEQPGVPKTTSGPARADPPLCTGQRTRTHTRRQRFLELRESRIHRGGPRRTRRWEAGWHGQREALSVGLLRSEPRWAQRGAGTCLRDERWKNW